MNLTDREKEIIKGHIDRGEPLPAKYKRCSLRTPRKWS